MRVKRKVENEIFLEQFYEKSRAKDNKPEDVVKYNEKFNVPYQKEKEEAETHSDKVKENLVDDEEIEKRKGEYYLAWSFVILLFINIGKMVNLNLNIL